MQIFINNLLFAFPVANEICRGQSVPAASDASLRSADELLTAIVS